MGLTVSHGAWEGGYGSFGNFRRWLGAAIGIDVDAMQGYGGSTPWPAIEDEPLVALLHHSDCDDDIPVEQLPGLARRLREVAPLVLAVPPLVRDLVARRTVTLEPQRWHDAAIDFAQGADEAAAEGVALEFW